MAIGVIPVRYDSTRFPGKPLALICDRPLVRWVYDGACQAAALSEVLVATDDERIREAAEGFGARCVITGGSVRNGTERVAAAVAGLEADVVVNVQGDEALITGPQIDAAVRALQDDPGASVATLAVAFDDDSRLDDPDAVKVVLDEQGRALAFSRARVPLPSRPDAEPLLHVGVYVYRRAALDKYTDLQQTEAEQSERLEQLRFLEHGHGIRVVVIEAEPMFGVDSPEAIPEVERILRSRGA